MLLFLSWSGARSKAVAECLSTWLEKVIQAAEPWISLDIDKGARWSPEIAQRLEASRVGIICLTPENLGAPWLLFEAGALSKTKDAYVCTFLLGLAPTDVQQPLGQFQHTIPQREDVRRLVGTINRAVQASDEKALPEKTLDDVFDTYWPALETELEAVISQPASMQQAPRPEREMLQEILELLRAQERRREMQELQEAMLTAARNSMNLGISPAQTPAAIAKQGLRRGLLSLGDSDPIETSASGLLGMIGGSTGNKSGL